MSHSMSSPRNIQLVFETYQKARLVFVQTMAELATRATNVKCLESAGVLELLRPLLSDACSSVRQCAVVAAARLCEHDEGVARQLLNEGMVTITLENLHKYNVYYKRSALYLIRAVAKHNEELAGVIVRLGALEHIVSCLEDFDTQVKENAAWALGYIGKHSESLAGLVVDAGTLPLLVLAFQEPEMSLKQLAQLVVNTGGSRPLVELLSETAGGVRVPSCMALGFIAGQSDQLAMAVIEAKAIPALVEILQNTEAEDAELCAAAWTIGHISKHSPQHSLAIAVANALPRLLQLYTNPKSSGEVRARASCALKQSLQCCLHRPALEPLLHAAPACILKYVLAQYAKILPNDARARRLFVTTGALKRVQEIDTVPGTSLKEYINIINSCFPEEIVRYYTPGYSDSLLDRVEAYTPQIPELFTDRVPSDCQSELTIENGN
ncbi:sperm-associated antigen 6-like isoform X6 [Galleria mellonella]|uniref:Sperm-associated antigen 6-like isoform X6 n=1 Tax=Galleria mellonella TaxID=7137 RepID=A0A6J3C9Q0_GALME|nr:sperm-associated antigen 6-like isoform X6 [Galleria mellonella]